MIGGSLFVGVFLALVTVKGYVKSRGIERRSTTTSRIFSSPGATRGELYEFDYENTDRLPWEDGSRYNSWNFRGSTINWVACGDVNKPKLVLIHGFGASLYHFRKNIPQLAKDYRVFAVDMLGFGLSDKPIIDYTAELWRDQTLAFLEEVVVKEGGRAVVCGNSLGGFTALYAAASDKADKLINGCILLNAAGRFKANYVQTSDDPTWLSSLKGALQRFVIGLSFIYTKQPARIEQVLRQVYPVHPEEVDEDLIESIRYPAQDPNAAEVFYRVIKKNGNGPPVFVDDLLATLKSPLLLLWGTQDPWIGPSAADKIQTLFPAASRVDINGGHCPHDECPDEVNAAIAGFMEGL